MQQDHDILELSQTKIQLMKAVVKKYFISIGKSQWISQHAINKMQKHLKQQKFASIQNLVKVLVKAGHLNKNEAEALQRELETCDKVKEIKIDDKRMMTGIGEPDKKQKGDEEELQTHEKLEEKQETSEDLRNIISKQAQAIKHLQQVNQSMKDKIERLKSQLTRTREQSSQWSKSYYKQFRKHLRTRMKYLKLISQQQKYAAGLHRQLLDEINK